MYKTINFFFHFPISVIQTKTLRITADGVDSMKCGIIPSCHTLGFVLSHRALDNDIIYIEVNKFLKHAKPFMIYRSYPLMKNISLFGINRPTISALAGNNVTHLFREETVLDPKVVTLRVKDLTFQGIGILRLIRMSTNNNVSFENCRFENNVVGLELIRVDSDHLCPSSVHLKYCYFHNNLIVNFTSVILLNLTQSSFDGCYFTNNYSLGKGSILIIGGSCVLKMSTFMKNAALAKKGGAIFTTENADVTVFNCTFSRNMAVIAGGAISTHESKLTVKASLFEYNTAVGRFGHGGAICSYKTSICDISNSSFRYNSAVLSGGSIFTFKTNILLIQTSSFLHNTVQFGNGGAISSNTAKDIYRTELIIKSSYFGNNTALRHGGAIHMYCGAICNIFNSFFERNTATCENGGALHHCGRKLIIAESSFEGNLVNGAISEGGAIFASALKYGRPTVIIRSSSFTNNNATERTKCRPSWILPVTAGGAISVGPYHMCHISNCSFHRNMAAMSGAIKFSGSNLTIKSSLFLNNYASGKLSRGSKFRGKLFGGAGGAIYSDSGSVCDISNCSFQRNAGGQRGGGIFFRGSKIEVKASNFEDNRLFQQYGQGSGIYISLNAICYILECTFKRNIANGYGGAINYHGSKLFVTDSLFQSNAAAGNRGHGGALYLKNYDGQSTVRISNCTFHKNKAYFRGGTIMAIEGRLFINNSSFWSSYYSHKDSYTGGELLYSISKVNLDNVLFQDNDNFNARSSLLIHQGFGEKDFSNRFHELFIGNGVCIKCLPGKSIAVSSHNVFSRKGFEFLTVSCAFCKQNSYSLSAGQLKSSSQSHSVTTTGIKCLPCPLGGRCENGRIRTTDNFWGYTSGNEVHFASCPFGYCCVGKECRNYSSCRTGRMGILCGQCEKGLTENLLSNSCLVPVKCHKPWFWLPVIIAGILYVLAFMYPNEATKIIKTLFIPHSVLRYIRYKCKCSCKISAIHKHFVQFVKGKIFHRHDFQYLTNDVFIEENENEEIYGRLELLYDPEMEEEEANNNEASKEEGSSSLLPGLLTIISFFYQTNILFKTYTGSKSSGAASLLQEAVSALFNIRIDGIFSQDQSWCPIHNLRPVSKILLKTSFVMYLFVLVLLIFTWFKIRRIFNLISAESYQLNNHRLLCCSLRLFLITYAGITTTCFSLLSCVVLGPFGKVLFVDGSIPCYRWWQLIVIFIVICWAFPFPIAIYTSSQLLHKGKLTTVSFFLSLLLPLPALCYWLYIRNCCIKQRTTEQRDLYIMSESAQYALEILEVPFRKSNSIDQGNRYRLSWESVLIARRLLLIFLKTFIINAFARLCAMLLCTIMFLIHHIYIKPYSSNFLNNTETLLLLMLTVIGFLNLVPAYNFLYPTCSYLQVKGVIDILRTTETILNLIVPCAIGLCISICVCIRILQVIFWFCRHVVKLILCCISLCMKSR